MNVLLSSICRILSRKNYSKMIGPKPQLLFKRKYNRKSVAPYKPLIYILPCLTFLSRPRSEVYQYDVEENIAHLMAMARIALEKGDADKAEAILEMGINICEEYQAFMTLPYMYDILVAISFARGNLGKAESLLVSVIEKLTQMGVPEDDSYIVDFTLRLARIYSSNNEPKLAEIGFKNCLNHQRAKILDGDTSSKTGMLYVNTLFWYGLHKIQNSQFKVAKQLINSAYDYSIKIKGLSPYQEMVILYTLADLNMELEEYDVALQNMQSAVLLGRGIGSLDLPRCYVKLSKIYFNLTAWNNAKQCAIEGFKLAELFNDREVARDAEEILDKINEKIFEAK